MVFGYDEGPLCSNNEENKIYEKSTSSSGPMDSVWPMRSHDARHTGQSEYGSTGNLLHVKWNFQMGEPIYSSNPVIASDGTIYVGAGLDATLFAINPDGTEKWSYFIENETNWGFSYITTPAIGLYGTIFVGTHEGYLYAISIMGEELWKINLELKIVNSPVIDENGIIYIGGGEKLFAVEPNGSIKWNFTTGYVISASPAIGNKDIIYVSSQDGYLYAIYTDNGSKKWDLKIGDIYDCYSSPAINEDGIIYIGGGGTIYAILPNGTILWEFTGPAFDSPSIATDGTIYVTTNSMATNYYLLYALNPDGTEKWHIFTGARCTPVIDKYGVIYTTKGKSGFGTYDLIRVSPQGEIISSRRIVPEDTDFLGLCPAMGENGIIYIGSWYNENNNGSIDDLGDLIALEVIERYNSPPEKPIINGTTFGKVHTYITYGFKSTDPEGDDILFYIDWDDGFAVRNIGPFPSGEEAFYYHYWPYWGVYNIKAKAVDIYGAESDWATLEVSMPKNKVWLSPLYQLLEWFPMLQHLWEELLT